MNTIAQHYAKTRLEEIERQRKVLVAQLAAIDHEHDDIVRNMIRSAV